MVALCLISVASAQDNTTQPKGRYVVPPRLRYDLKTPAASLQTWNGSFTYQGSNYTYNMVGTAPSTNSTTTVQVYVIPLKVVITPRRGSPTTYDPSHVLSNGKTVTNNTTTSPIFNSSTTYVQGGVDVGTTQYIDAFQRANFWGTVKDNPNYHLIDPSRRMIRVRAENTKGRRDRVSRTPRRAGHCSCSISIGDAAWDETWPPLPLRITSQLFSSDFNLVIVEVTLGIHKVAGVPTITNSHAASPVPDRSGPCRLGHPRNRDVCRSSLGADHPPLYTSQRS